MPIVDAFPLAFPGRAIKAGAGDPEVVLAIQRRLNAAGCGPVGESGRFGEPTTIAVRRFQMRFTDADGLPLKVDGVVGPITWAALFGTSNPLIEADEPLLKAALERATGEIGVLEAPPGSNRGPRVDTYLKAVGLDPGTGSFAWCAAFVYFCFNEASQRGGRRNPLVKTAGVLEHWNKAEQRGARRIKAADAMARPELIKPGQIFVMDFGKGAGHTGVVRGLRDGKLITIEGNTNDGGSREGIGVFERTGRTLGSINKGFLDYSEA
jgi:peptidoglycan hydrolase-like protein with peptidoglycan-binding domain